MSSAARCEESELPPLAPAEALRVVRPYFEAVREVYLAYGLSALKRTELRVDPKMHDTPRHFAACRDDARLILVAPEIADLPVSTLLGILAHEFGHAADFAYAGEWALRHRKVVRRDLEEAGDEQRRRWLGGWEARDDDAVELTADAIAELVTGERIGYQGPCLLQTLGGPGPRRPRGLR